MQGQTSLPKGMSTYAVIIGENEEGSLLVEMRGLKEFEMKLEKQELISCVSSLPFQSKALFNQSYCRSIGYLEISLLSILKA